MKYCLTILSLCILNFAVQAQSVNEKIDATLKELASIELQKQKLAEKLEGLKHLLNFKTFNAITMWDMIFFPLAAAIGIVAWFAIVITGKFPRGMFDFSLKVHRYMSQYSAYSSLLTDQYPKFG